MRQINPVFRDNAIAVQPTVNLRFTSPDGQWTRVHCNDDLNSISPISWQIPYGGGLGKPGTYRVDLALDLDDIKRDLARYVQAKTELNLILKDRNGTTSSIQPHVGKVRGIKRDPRNPNQMRLTIVDKLFDDNPAFPVEMITDSYQTPHLEELLSTNPIYYGKHHRPFYHVATDCDIGVLLGPRNVSSENHVTSVWFNSDMMLGADTTLEHNIQMGFAWANDVTSTNQISVTNSQVVDKFLLVAGGALQARHWRWSDNISTIDISPVQNVDSQGEVVSRDHGFISFATRHITSPDERSLWGAGIESLIPQPAFQLGRAFISITYSNWSDVNSMIHSINVLVSSGPGQDSVAGTTRVGAFNTMTESMNLYLSDDLTGALGQNKSIAFAGQIGAGVVGTASSNVTAVVSLNLETVLRSEGYIKHSIFSNIQNSADIAISTNPIGILDDIYLNHTSLAFNALQSSEAQVLINSFQFQTYHSSQLPITELADEFARIAGFYTWATDSGLITYRAYQESGSAPMDRILGIDDYTDLELDESPIGTTENNQKLASKINAGYAFDFQTRRFGKTKRARPDEVALCNSLDASGITKSFDIDTKYITDPDVASLWIGNLVRFHSQPTEYVTVRGGFNLFDLELADVFKLENALLVGSESVYQVIKAQMDILNGTMQVTGAKLVSTTGD